MKKKMVIVLCVTMVFSGCSSASSMDKPVDSQVEVSIADSDERKDESAEQADSNTNPLSMDLKEIKPSFNGMDDPELLYYVENNVYTNLVHSLESDEYFVENVDAVYISQEYIDELSYNAQSNIYFGYTLEELDQLFKGDRYVFALDENGETTVSKMETVNDNSSEKIIKNVTMGGGVILICVTVSVVSAGVGATALSMIFAAAAKTGTTFAISSAAIGGVAATITTGYQTHDPETAFKAGSMAASEGFKWGAISGTVIGGIHEGTTLYGAAKQTNFTMNQYAKIQKESGYPLDVIKQFHTMDEYKVFRDAKLKHTMVGNKSALIKMDIDLTRIDSKGRTNLERMRQGLAPRDSNGKSYELHHVGQRKDGTLAILSQSEHDNSVIHGFLERTEVHGPGNNWDEERQMFWKTFAAMFD